MNNKLHVITGASGQLGSHIAVQLSSSGQRVRAVIRQNSDSAYLEELGVDIIRCDFREPASIQSAVEGADVVYQCAARVSDWGPWSIFQSEVVDVAGSVLKACEARKVGRVLFVSSISVYGHPKIGKGETISEEAPLGQNMWIWDHYAKAKILSEEHARQYKGDIVIVRPSWIYGPRDRVTIPRVVPALRERRVPIIGSGENLLNLIYAADVARGCILAAKHSDANGQAYNLSSRGELTQRQMLDTLTDALALPAITKKVPLFLVTRVAFMQELFARMIGKKKPPTITRRAVYLIGRSSQYSIEKAKKELGWEPEVGINRGVQETMDWFTQQEKEQSKNAAI